MQSHKEFKSNVVIKVIGVGGGGNNAINRMVDDNVQGINDFIVANTDAQVLESSPAPTKIVLGKQVSKGLGAGADPEIGRKAAIESEKEIKSIIGDANLVFIAAGMGGGTGTGAAPEIARMATECGALVIGVVTKPFDFEGRMRKSYAIQGIEELKKYVDSIIIISNNRLLQIIGALPVMDSFKEADNILKQAVQAITDLIAVPSLINLDFADINTIMKGKGNALFGIGIGEGEGKTTIATNKAITSSLLETSIRGAKNAIINVTGGSNISLNDGYDAVDIIQQAAGDEQMNIIFGIAVNEHLEDSVIVTIIATGFDTDYVPYKGKEEHQKQQSMQQQSSQQPIQSFEMNNNQIENNDRNFKNSNQGSVSYGDTNYEDDNKMKTAYEKRTSFISDNQDDGFINENNVQFQKMNNQANQNLSKTGGVNQVAQKMDDSDLEDEDFPTFLRKDR